jgi:hypothetical protein
MLSTFVTPKVRQGRRASAPEVIERVLDAGGEVMLDPATYGVLFPTTSDWTSYQSWALWDGARGDLSTRALRSAHVLRVLEAQFALSLPPLAPTIALDSSLGVEAERALELAETARSQGSEIRLAIVGTSSFWAQGRLLDDFVGQVAQLRPAGVYLSTLRQGLTYPPTATSAEVSGLCRSVYSFTQRCEVVVQHSDLFGLPAVAAGAAAAGTGWDLRQRLLAPDAFRSNTTVRRTAHRITHAGLFGVLKRPEAELVRAADRALSIRLVPGRLPANGNPLWEHHVSVFADQVAALVALPDVRQRSALLATQYESALVDFETVDDLAALEADSTRWLTAVSTGLSAFRADEGW